MSFDSVGASLYHAIVERGDEDDGITYQYLGHLWLEPDMDWAAALKAEFPTLALLAAHEFPVVRLFRAGDSAARFTVRQTVTWVRL